MKALSIDQLKECFESATRFLEVADYLSQDLGGIVTGNMYPCIVNGAFACELFLKAIIGTSNPSGIPKSHKHRELFLMLDKKTQNEIETEYLKSSDFPLDDLFTESDNTFVEWRYAHEHKVQLHYIALIELGKALKNTARHFFK